MAGCDLGGGTESPAAPRRYKRRLVLAAHPVVAASTSLLRVSPEHVRRRIGGLRAAPAPPISLTPRHARRGYRFAWKATLFRRALASRATRRPSTQGRKPGRAEAWPGRNPADDLRATRRVEGVLEGGVLLPAVAYRCRIAGMANGGGEPRPRRTGRRVRARRTRRDPDGRKRCDRQKRSYTSSHENTPFHRFLLSSSSSTVAPTLRPLAPPKKGVSPRRCPG
jgi:hypothetical protein